MLKITNLFDSNKFVDLHDSEMKIIQGGVCIEGFRDGLVFYPAGSIVKRNNGFLLNNDLLYKCVDNPALSGEGVWVLYKGD